MRGSGGWSRAELGGEGNHAPRGWHLDMLPVLRPSQGRLQEHATQSLLARFACLIVVDTFHQERKSVSLLVPDHNPAPWRGLSSAPSQVYFLGICKHAPARRHQKGKSVSPLVPDHNPPPWRGSSFAPSQVCFPGKSQHAPARHHQKRKNVSLLVPDHDPAPWRGLSSAPGKVHFLGRTSSLGAKSSHQIVLFSCPEGDKRDCACLSAGVSCH